jgi:transcription antitermination protein NusB
MLSRRHLRIRVMQSLYTWYQSEDRDIRTSVGNLFKGTERTYDLYLSLLQLLPELAHHEEKYYLDLPPRHIKKEEPVMSRLSDNCFIQFLEKDPVFTGLIHDRKITWQKEGDLIRKLFLQLRQSPEYKNYISAEKHSEPEDVDFCGWIFKNIIQPSAPLTTSLEEQNIWWAESLDLIYSMVLKTIRVAHPGKKGKYELMPMFRDEQDDKEFMERLFVETVKSDDYFEKLIAEKTRNWDVDRIALMDVILLKMTLGEILNFPSIPVKVSINEYIDISKDFSTPKSKIFINGVIDKLVGDLREKGEVHKTGRGLLE